MRLTVFSLCVFAVSAFNCVAGKPVEKKSSENVCRKTKVAVLGAGVAGITAAQALTSASVSDFVIVEYNDEIGGRVKHTTFGNDIVVELGANWVQGLGVQGGPENPIWTLVKRYGIKNTYSNYSDITTYDETGPADFGSAFKGYDISYAVTEQIAAQVMLTNLQSPSMAAMLATVGWKPGRDKYRQAVEWLKWDWEYAYPPDLTSLQFGIINYNTTFYQFSQENNYVFDQRGFNTFIKGEADRFLWANDSRLLLNTIVTNITYDDSGVTVLNKDGSCILADYAICTFSLGVLQNGVVTFSPSLPKNKLDAINHFQMGLETKIFLEFPYDFWSTPSGKSQFLLYASPNQRGYYPIFQSLTSPGFIPDSNVIFVTLVHDLAVRAESMSDDAVKDEVLQVLREMFPDIEIPEPTSFLYPRWGTTPWAYGSYSNWPPGLTLEKHQNLRYPVSVSANGTVGGSSNGEPRLWFAGEHTSSEYFGFLHGAWFEGKAAGENVASCINNNSGCAAGVGGADYTFLYGTTDVSEYTIANGWDNLNASFATWGL